MITEAIDRAFERAESENWWELYVAVDIHGTIFPSTYDPKIQRQFYPEAKETLQYLSQRPDVKLFLLSCSTLAEYIEVSNFLRTHKIIMNGSGSTSVQYAKGEDRVKYWSKPYYNLLIDDKAGFSPEEWKSIKEKFQEYPVLKKHTVDIHRQ